SPPAPYASGPTGYSQQPSYGQPQSTGYAPQAQHHDNLYPSAPKQQSSYTQQQPSSSYAQNTQQQQYPASNFGTSQNQNYARPAPASNARPQNTGFTAQSYNNAAAPAQGYNFGAANPGDGAGSQFATTGSMNPNSGGGGGMGAAGNQPHGGPNFFGQDFINDFQGSAAGQLGMQLGTKAFAQVQENVNQNLNRWINISQLKYYFNVSNSYVLHKILLLLFPFRHQPWSRLVRRSEQSGQMEGYKPPREDLNAPDLYIPVMSFVTYILIVGIQLGLEAKGKADSAVGGSKSFSPDVLAGTGTTAFFVIFAEVLFIKLGCYLLNVTGEVGFLELGGYCGYKFVGIIATYAAKIFLPTWAVYAVFTYVMLCFGFFTLRTLKYIVLPDSINPVVHPMRKRRIHFLFVVALVQILLSWLLV
ncbi:hypothetical protein HK097_011520, partial [Rhizophlyctis rosea]